MRTFLIKSFLFAFAALIAVQSTGAILNWASKKNDQEKIFWLNSKKDQKYTFAFLGSSRVLNMVDVKYLEDTWQTSGINLGSAGSGFADNYLVLYEFYKNGNHSNNLFLQIDEQSLDPEKGFGYPFHEHLFFNLLGDKIADEVFIDQSGKIKYFAWKHFPFLRYIEFNNPYKEFILGLFDKKINYDLSRGSELLEKKEVVNWSPKEMIKDWQVSTEGKEYLEKIIDLAQEHETNVILYTAPYPAEINKNPAVTGIEDYIIKYAHKKNIQYLNFRGFINSNDKKYFRNLVHLNKEGTALFMSAFAPEAKRTMK
jgi:hypothetical protein